MRIAMVVTFVKLASTRNVAETARTLKYSESTVWYHIRCLEKSWRVTLFDRETRSLILTEEGRTALRLAGDFLLLARRLEALGRMGHRLPALAVHGPPVPLPRIGSSGAPRSAVPATSGQLAKETS